MAEYQKLPERKEKSAAYRAKNKEAIYARSKQWRQENPVRAAWLGLKDRVQKANAASRLHNPVDITLDFEAFQRLVSATTCPICGVTMKEKGKHNQHDPAMKTIDRIVAGGDYSPENCACICWRCNQIKNDGTADEHLAIAIWMKRMNPR